MNVVRLGITPGPIELVAVSGPGQPKKLVPCKERQSLLTIINEDDSHKFGAVFNDADAKLYAAAPDLLEALIDSTILLEKKVGSGRCNHTMGICFCADMAGLSKAQIALEKATGLAWPELKDRLLEVVG
jgi:hypothetical protein